jgi:DNA (cytosine-5)-methyltransferase 1
MTFTSLAVPLNWPILAPEQTLSVFQADGACAAAALAAATGIAAVRRDIECLASLLLAAATTLVAASIADQAIAQGAVDVFETEFRAAASLPAGARRKVLFGLRDDMVDLAAWLDSSAMEGGVPRRAQAADPDAVSDYAHLVIIRHAGRLLAALAPDVKPRYRYLSFCSGIEAATAALMRIGAVAEPVVFADNDVAASAVLKAKWPDVINAGDVTTHNWSQYNGGIEFILGGAPCQSFSVAGRRLGLDDPRGNLSLHYLRVVDLVRPKWFLYENVPGLLSSGGGRDFELFLEIAEKIGYSCAWRVLDAKHFGSTPQRRRRVFVVGHLGTDWRPPAAVLFEPQGEGGDPLADRTAWQTAPRRSGGSAADGVKVGSAAVAYGVAIRGRETGAVAECQAGAAYALRTAGGGSSYPMVAYAADMRHGTISTSETMTLQVGNKAQGYSLNTIPCAVYDEFREQEGSVKKWTVRRFTPKETLRLQGFDDDWLDGVCIRGKPLSDSHRYKLIGNSWAVPCAAFILDRLIGWDELQGIVPTAEQMLDAERLLEAREFEIFTTRDDGVAGFMPGAGYGLLLIGYDARGPLFRPIDPDGITDEARFLNHPVTIEAAIRQLDNRDRSLDATHQWRISEIPGEQSVG